MLSAKLLKVKKWVPALVIMMSFLDSMKLMALTDALVIRCVSVSITLRTAMELMSLSICYTTPMRISLKTAAVLRWLVDSSRFMKLKEKLVPYLVMMKAKKNMDKLVSTLVNVRETSCEMKMKMEQVGK